MNSLSEKSPHLNSVVADSLNHASSHYENFPVASILLPKNLRVPIALIYSFARQADDFADEEERSAEERLLLLNQFRNEIELLQAYIKPNTEFFYALGNVIKAHKLPYQPFFDLLDAFSQDVVKTRYQNETEVLDYCRRSANPIGRLLLHLYHAATPENIQMADQICSALQLINFLQDIAIDFQKNAGKQRIYLCQDELQQFGISETLLAAYISGHKAVDQQWQTFMQHNLSRAQHLLRQGKPLGKVLKGRIGLEMRLIIAGGEQMIKKITQVKGDVFNHRPTLSKVDWIFMLFKAIIRA